VSALATETIAFTAFGVPLAVEVPASLHEAALEILPPSAVLDPEASPWARIEVRESDGLVSVACDDAVWAAPAEEELALGLLDAQIRAQVALMAPEHIFVHAGVVAHNGGAIVLPGFSFAGKTTLVRALVQAGADYLSDEFAVFDRAGRVHPYPKPLSIRRPDGGGATTETPAAMLGARTELLPVPLRLIAVTAYRPGAVLDPEPLAPGAALLALLGHTIPARTRPAQSMAALKAAVIDAEAWNSDRGEAETAARQILAWLG
jgi:hypothetical protein